MDSKGFKKDVTSSPKMKYPHSEFGPRGTGAEPKTPAAASKLGSKFDKCGPMKGKK